MQVLWAVSVVPESVMKNPWAMGQEMRAGVQAARNRTVGGGDTREHVGDSRDRSGILKESPWDMHR
jgi:hypothetical protein